MAKTGGDCEKRQAIQSEVTTFSLFTFPFNVIYTNKLTVFFSLSSSTHMHSLNDMDMCSLKALEADGSPSRSLLKLIGDQGCMVGELVEFLQIMGHTDALHCLKPSGTTASV